MFKQTSYLIASFTLWLIVIVMFQFAIIMSCSIYRNEPIGYHPWFNPSAKVEIINDGQNDNDIGTDSYNYEEGHGTQD